jgi:hypothetical protein
MISAVPVTAASDLLSNVVYFASGETVALKMRLSDEFDINRRGFREIRFVEQPLADGKRARCD